MLARGSVSNPLESVGPLCLMEGVMAQSNMKERRAPFLPDPYRKRSARKAEEETMTFAMRSGEQFPTHAASQPS